MTARLMRMPQPSRRGGVSVSSTGSVSMTASIVGFWTRGVPRMTPDGTFAGYIGSVIDIAERRHVEEMLRKIAQGVPCSTSDEFVRSLARRLSDVLAVDFVFVGLLAGENHDRIKTVAALMDGEIRENIEYDLKKHALRERN